MMGTDESITDPAEVHARFLRSVLSLEPDESPWHRPGGTRGAASTEKGGPVQEERPARRAPRPAKPGRKRKHPRP